MDPGVGGPSPVWADALTLLRFALAIGILFLLAANRPVDAGVLLVVGWTSDLLDGRIARRARGDTRFGHLDLPADAAMGIAVLAGLATSGRMPPAITAAGGILAVGLGWWMRNPAPILLAMGTGYGAFLLAVWRADDTRRWIVLLAPVALLALEWRRLFGVIVPAFLHAGARVLRLAREQRHRTIDEWSRRRRDEPG